MLIALVWMQQSCHTSTKTGKEINGFQYTKYSILTQE
jgi:hypothetical protein